MDKTASLLARISVAGDDPDRLIAAATDLLKYAEQEGADGEDLAAVLDIRVNAHLMDHAAHQQSHLAPALTDCQRALALTPDGHPHRVARMVRVAVLLGDQVDGDPRGRAQSSEVILREALTLVDEKSDPGLVALIRSNLALALQVQARKGDLELLREARDLCMSTLAYRSPERNAEDWAYSVINLGVILGRLAELGEAKLNAAREAYESVIRHAESVPRGLVAHAGVNLLNATFEEVVSGDPELDTQPEHRAALEAAVELAREVASAPGASVIARGRALRRVGVLAERVGDLADAETALREAVRLLDGADLKELQLAGWNLATCEIELGDWDGAAAAYRQALRATDLLISAPLDPRDRAAEIAAASRLPRWAARAFAEIGELEEAVITLENGRARELRRQLQFDDPKLKELEKLAPDAIAKWKAAAAPLSETAVSAESARAYKEAFEELRGLPGFADFESHVTLREVRDGATDRSPVLYVDPTPYGTVLLRVDTSGEIDYRLLQVTSQDIVLRVQYGFDPRYEQMPNEFVSYSFAAAATTDDMEDGRELPDIGPALDRLLPWVGEHVATPVDEMLRSHHDRELVLVVSGPLATVPLVAAPLSGRFGCLLDSFVISTTPSATLHAASRRRANAASETFSCLVSVADPTYDLEFARTEVEQISSHFASVVPTEGQNATCDWVREHANKASVVHLACHAFGGLLDATRSGFVLADGDLTGPEVARLGPLHARLAVASACQSAAVGIGGLADEAFSLGAALLAAGAACAIASLWRVDDLATAILMTRLYEELASGLAPPTALARTQRWLRTLTHRDQQAFLIGHPRLADEARKRGLMTTQQRSFAEEDQPYSHPSYWAAFVALGA